MATVRDPVCGMPVDTAKAVTLDHGTHVHHFCCGHCRRIFLADPARYGDAHALSVPKGRHAADASPGDDP